MSAVEGGEAGGQGAYANKEKTVLTSLIVDFLLWIPDIVAALLSGSITLFADAVKCGNEIIATFLSYLTLRKMSRGENGIYDYGMGKFENLVGIITGGVMFISVILVFCAALYRIAVPASLVEEGTYLGICLMILGVITNTALCLKNRRVTLKNPSPIMESQWRLFRAKAFSDASVLAALVMSVTLAQYSWSRYIDPLASFVIVGFLIFSGYHVIASSLPDLLDKTLDEELQIVIMQQLASYFHDYIALHGVRSRRSGTRIYVEIFLEFDGDRKMSEVQAIVDSMTQSLESRIPRTSVSVVLSSSPPSTPDE